MITASRSLIFISSRLRSSLVCISFCRSVRFCWKRCIIPSLFVFHDENSFGNRLIRPNFIKVSKDSSSIFSERRSTTSSPLKHDSVKVVLIVLRRTRRTYKRRRICEALRSRWRNFSTKVSACLNLAVIKPCTVSPYNSLGDKFLWSTWIPGGGRRLTRSGESIFQYEQG